MSAGEYGHLIGGRRVPGCGTFPVVNPADESVVGWAPEISREGIDEVLAAAGAAFPSWSLTPLAGRRALALRYAEVLEAHRSEIVELLVAETGKPEENAAYDFGMLTECLRYFAEEIARVRQEVIPDPDGRFLHYIIRQPLGVAVGFLAWNFPLLNLGYKLGPALAAGCAVVVKPSRHTPLATLRCAELAGEAGLPPGVLNVVCASDHAVSLPLLESRVPRLFTMIGSTSAGVAAMRSASTSVKRFSVELGGNAPVIVYDDAEIGQAAESVVDLKFANSGQVCVSPNRCFVHERVYDRFVEAARDRASGIALGAGRGEGRRMGPMIDATERARVMGLVADALSEGAGVAIGGGIPPTHPKGYWFEPTILVDVIAGMRVAREEIFGPVLPVIRFGDGDDPVALANDTEYGLAAYVFTSDLRRALRAAAGIDAGSVCVNEPHYAVQLPHGGVKQSGVGKDCSPYSIEEYLTMKRVSIRV